MNRVAHCYDPRNHHRHYQTLVLCRSCLDCLSFVVYRLQHVLQYCERNVEDWQRILRVRSLVLTEQENRHTLIKFASLCRKSNRLVSWISDVYTFTCNSLSTIVGLSLVSSSLLDQQLLFMPFSIGFIHWVLNSLLCSSFLEHLLYFLQIPCVVWRGVHLQVGAQCCALLFVVGTGVVF